MNTALDNVLCSKKFINFESSVKEDVEKNANLTPDEYAAVIMREINKFN